MHFSQYPHLIDAQTLCAWHAQVRDLMMYFEGQRLVSEASPDMGLVQGSVSVPTPPPAPRASALPPKRRATRKR